MQRIGWLVNERMARHKFDTSLHRSTNVVSRPCADSMNTSAYTFLFTARFPLCLKAETERYSRRFKTLHLNVWFFYYTAAVQKVNTVAPDTSILVIVWHYSSSLVWHQSSSLSHTIPRHSSPTISRHCLSQRPKLSIVSMGNKTCMHWSIWEQASTVHCSREVRGKIISLSLPRFSLWKKGKRK